MQNTTEHFKTIINRESVDITLTFNPGGEDKGHPLYGIVDVEIKNQRIVYNCNFFLQYSDSDVRQNLGRDWSLQKDLYKLLAKDATRVILNGQDSDFISMNEGRFYLVSHNEIINSLAKEQNTSGGLEEARIIELFLLAFENNINLSCDSIYIATNFKESGIKRKLSYYCRRGYISQTSKTSNEYEIKSIEMLEKLETKYDKLSVQQGEEKKIPSVVQLRYLNPIKPIIDRPIAFVGIPFKLKDHIAAIEEVCKKNGFLAYIINQDPRFDTFLNKVVGAVLASKVCIFDVTEFNPNVMLELGVAMSTNVNIIVVADEKKYVEEETKWKEELHKTLDSEDHEKLENVLKDSKFINLIPADVRERPVHLFNGIDNLKSKLDNSLKQLR